MTPERLSKLVLALWATTVLLWVLGAYLWTQGAW